MVSATYTGILEDRTVDFLNESEDCNFDRDYITRAVNQAAAVLAKYLEGKTVSDVANYLEDSYVDYCLPEDYKDTDCPLMYLSDALNEAQLDLVYYFGHSVMGSGTGLFEIFKGIPNMNFLV